MPENGRKGAFQPQPSPAQRVADAARQLGNVTSELMDRLQYRLLSLRTVDDPEARAIAMECERALAEIREELNAMAADERGNDL